MRGAAQVEPRAFLVAQQDSPTDRSLVVVGEGAIEGAPAEVRTAWQALGKLRTLRGALAKIGDAGRALAGLTFALGFERGREYGDTEARRRASRQEFTAQLSSIERERLAATDNRDRRVREHFAALLGLRADATWPMVLERFESTQETMRTLGRWAAGDATVTREQLRAVLAALPEGDQ